LREVVEGGIEGKRPRGRIGIEILVELYKKESYDIMKKEKRK